MRRMPPRWLWTSRAGWRWGRITWKQDEDHAGFKERRGAVTEGVASIEQGLTEEEVRKSLERALSARDLRGKRVLVIIPDGTRSGPTGLFFRLLYDLLWGRVATLDYLIALGTHPPMDDEAIQRHLGLDETRLRAEYGGARIFNHRWERNETFVRLGTIPADAIAEITEGRFAQEVPVTVNRMILDYDLLLICGPVFPHEVAGFSGGNKYLFPGISGPEVINFTHWLGALLTSYAIIGTKDTAVRAVIDRAASMVPVPTLACCYVAREHGLAGVFVGEPQRAWARAAEVSAAVHIRTVPRPFRRVLALMPARYDDLWTGAKGMYKLEPVVEDGGELIIYAPHITEVSYTHGHLLDEIGYHVRDYFVKQWERFRGYPWGVLAHSTHLRGQGSYDEGVELPRVRVTLATGIPPERCARLGIGYCDPVAITLEAWEEREEEGILLVRDAGEVLYRVREEQAA
jgi:lactate racemase